MEIANNVSSTAGKNNGVPLVPLHVWKCLPTAISGAVEISEVLECHLLRQMSSQLRVTTITLMIGAS